MAPRPRIHAHTETTQWDYHHRQRRIVLRYWGTRTLSLAACFVQRSDDYAVSPTLSVDCCTDQSATSYQAPYYDFHFCSCFTHAFVSGSSVPRLSFSALTSYVDIQVAFSEAVLIPQQGSNWNPNTYPGFTVHNAIVFTSTATSTTRYANAVMRPTWSWGTLFRLRSRNAACHGALLRQAARRAGNREPLRRAA